MVMSMFRATAPLWAMLWLLAAAPETLAQDPPSHKPGTVCRTPKFWCWATRPGKVDDQCYCSTPTGGRVSGRLE